MANKWHEIMNTENYFALAVSIMGPKLICPELAFETLGINCFSSRQDLNKYRWNTRGDKLWREFSALREIGWYWEDIAAYFGLNKSSAMTLYSQAKKKYGRKGDRK